MSQNNNKSDLKKFFIKLLAITFSIIIIINITYNLIFAEKFENINILLSLKNKESREVVKNKIRSEIKKGLEKDKILKNSILVNSIRGDINLSTLFYLVIINNLE